MQFGEEDWCWTDTIKGEVVVPDPTGWELERNSSNELFKNAKTFQKVSAGPLNDDLRMLSCVNHLFISRETW